MVAVIGRLRSPGAMQNHRTMQRSPFDKHAGCETVGSPSRTKYAWGEGIPFPFSFRQCRSHGLTNLLPSWAHEDPADLISVTTRQLTLHLNRIELPTLL